MRYRIVETRWGDTEDWRPSLVLHEGARGLRCTNPYACKFGTTGVEAPSLDHVEVSMLALWPGTEARIRTVQEAPDPPPFSFLEALQGFLRDRFPYICPRCCTVGTPILYGLNWMQMLREDQKGQVLVREENLPGGPELADERFARDDYQCPACKHEWNGHEEVWGES